MIQAIQSAAQAWECVWRMSWQGAVLIGVVLVLRAVLRERLTPGLRGVLWLVVGVRLAAPMMPTSSWSVFNLWEGERGVSEVVVDGSAWPPVVETDGGAPVVVVEYGGIESAMPVEVGPVRPPSVSIWAWCWLAGMLVCLGWIILGQIRLGIRLRRMIQVEDAHVLGLVRRCCDEMAVRRDVRVVQTDAFRSPAVAGMFRPTLILPMGFFETVSMNDLRLIILHELGHVRRGDVMKELAWGVLRAVHWFNPMVWMACAAARMDREMGCDARVLKKVTAEDRPEYAGCLVRVVEAMSRLRPGAGTVGMFHRARGLRGRLKMIGRFDSSRRVWNGLAAAVVVLLGVVGLTDAQDGPGTNPQHQEVPSTQPVKSAAMEAASEKLAKRIDFNYQANGATFGAAVDFLSAESGVTFFVDWRLLELAEITPTTPITSRSRDVSIEKTLKFVLMHAGGGTSLGYYINTDGVVVITLASELTERVTRVYDIRDLIIVIPDFTPEYSKTAEIRRRLEQIRKEFGYNPGGVVPGDEKPEINREQSGRNEVTAKEMQASVINLIKKTVVPEDWRDGLNQIHVLEGQLIITATVEQHRLISALFRQLRENRGVQISIEARFVAIDLNQADEALRKILAPTLQEESHGAFLKPEEAEKLLRDLQNVKNATIVTAPRLTLFNGQRAYVTVGTDRMYIEKYNMTKNANGDATFEPITATVNTGFMLDIQATASADRKTTTVTARPKLSRLRGIEEVPWRYDGKETGLTIQKPDVEAHEIVTTVTFSDGWTLLISDGQAMSIPVEKGVGQLEEQKQTLFVLLKPTIILHEIVPAE